MRSYEIIVKIAEIRKRVEEGDLLSAQKVLDTMETKKIKSVNDLNLIAQVYYENERYEEAVELYHKIFDKTKSRRSLYQLIDVLIKLNETDTAEIYLEQYEKIAPEDFYNMVFRYKIDKQKGKSFEHLIGILVELKHIEYTEKWAYELAKLYYKAGLEEECIRECSDIILWFGEGTYVEKARILRSYYTGEADRDRIMEEIKQRAEEVNSRSYYEDPDQEEEELTRESSRDSSAYEEEIYNDSDFMVNEEAEELEDGLRSDIRTIMENHQPSEYSDQDSADYEEEDTYPEQESSLRDEMTYYEEDKEMDGDTIAFSKGVASDYSEDSTATTGYDHDEEQEVEQTIYQLLEEEKLNEEDRYLKLIADEYHIDQDEIFGNFLHVSSIKKQLVKSLEIIERERNKNVMMLITGTTGSGKTTLAKDIALYLNQTNRLKSSKVAKIKAEKLNTIEVSSKKDTLKDCCLVVEDASELSRQTIESILNLSNKLPGALAVIFEENKKNMNKLFRTCPKLMDLMKNRIHLPQYAQEDLIGFAFAYLKQKDYKLNPKAEQRVKSTVSQIIKQVDPDRYLTEINSVMQSAMDAADIRAGRQLSKLADQGRLKDVEVLTVIAEDFQAKP